jgi:serine/threonine protein phosphatase 1
MLQSGLDNLMATIAIGDIHGELEALTDLLLRLQPELSPGDTVVFLGDYIDRGPRSKWCIDRILDFSASTSAEVVGLLGNHEEWLLRTLDNPTRHAWLLAMDAFPTIESYSPEAATAIRAAAEEAGGRLYSEKPPLPYELFFDAMPSAHKTFLRGLRTYAETGDVLCVHGGIDARDGPPNQQSAKSLVWGTTHFQTEYEGPAWLVYGHWHNTTVDDSGRCLPTVIGRTIGIDTIEHGVLTAVRFPDLSVFQSGRSEPLKLDA